jgi:hypothetical protein
VVTKENVEFSFSTTIHGNQAIDFVNDAETLAKLNVITGLANEADPLVDLALSGDILKDPPHKRSSYVDVENAKATVLWKMTVDKSEYALKGLDVEVVDVSFSATLSLVSAYTDESVDTNVKVVSARESGFDLNFDFDVSGWLTSFPCKPRKVDIDFDSKEITVHF